MRYVPLQFWSYMNIYLKTTVDSKKKGSQNVYKHLVHFHGKTSGCRCRSKKREKKHLGVS